MCDWNKWVKCINGQWPAAQRPASNISCLRMHISHTHTRSLGISLKLHDANSTNITPWLDLTLSQCSTKKRHLGIAYMHRVLISIRNVVFGKRNTFLMLARSFPFQAHSLVVYSKCPAKSWKSLFAKLMNNSWKWSFNKIVVFVKTMCA